MAGQTYGRSTIANVGQSIKVTADGCPEMKQAGVTIDWTSVVAAPADIELANGVQVVAGEKYLRYGQVITNISGGEITVLTPAAGSSGDTFTVTVNGQTTAAIAYDATAAAVDTAVELLSTVGTGGVVVTGSAGGPWTLAFLASLGDMTVTSAGTGMTVTVTTTSQGARNGMYGPYDPAAVDGRAVIANGGTFILNQTVKENDLHSAHPEVLFGGLVWKDRLIQSGVATHTLAAGPTLAELLAVFPRLQLVTETPA